MAPDASVDQSGPGGAISERDQIQEVWAALEDPTKTVVVQTAPAVRRLQLARPVRAERTAAARSARQRWMRLQELKEESEKTFQLPPGVRCSAPPVFFAPVRSTGVVVRSRMAGT